MRAKGATGPPIKKFLGSKLFAGASEATEKWGSKHKSGGLKSKFDQVVF